MKDYIKIGIEKNLISFNEDMSRITYVFQNKERNFNNPEEKVQAETFLRLRLDYNYPESRIKQFVPVTMGRAQAKKNGRTIRFSNHHSFKRRGEK